MRISRSAFQKNLLLHILKLIIYACFISAVPRMVILEYMSNGSLESYLKVNTLQGAQKGTKHDKYLLLTTCMYIFQFGRSKYSPLCYARQLELKEQQIKMDIKITLMPSLDLGSSICLLFCFSVVWTGRIEVDFSIKFLKLLRTCPEY